MRFNISIFILTVIAVSSCQKKNAEESTKPEKVEVSPNQLLYEQVVAIHDEVMPRMGEIYRLKKDLREKLDKDASLSAEKKEELRSIIAKLEAADEGMMDWMHEFKPIPDSLGEEKARKYLESEMIRVKKVKVDMESAIELARQQ